MRGRGGRTQPRYIIYIYIYVKLSRNTWKLEMVKMVACICMCGVHACICICEGAQACGDQMSGVFFNQCLPYILKQRMSLNLKLSGSASLVSQHAPRIPFSPSESTVITGELSHLYISSGGLNSSSHTLRANTLSTESSPQPLIYVFDYNKIF